MRPPAAGLADRRGFDPSTWDSDQERAARDAVVETAAGHVVTSVPPHVLHAAVRSMSAPDPAPLLASVDAPVSLVLALAAPGYPERAAEARRASDARVTA